MVEKLNGEEVEIFLEMEMRKGNFQEDKDFFYFDVEASNENLDLEQQQVLQRALLGSQDYFLTNGVVSKDHLHKRVDHGRQITDEQYVIGEPVKVYKNGKSTRVTGRLYKSNEHAQKFIDLLRSKSTRVKASVGGIIPKVVKTIEGTEKVVSVLWNDLALTIAPVNYTVSPAAGVMVKSLTSLEFVKSLAVGYGTDSGKFTGGRALTKEDVEHSTVERSNPDYAGAISDLVGALARGKVGTLEEAKNFLNNYGFSAAVSLDVIREIASKHKEFAEVLPMAKKSGSLFAGFIENIRKSMSGGKIYKGGVTDPDPDDPDGDDGDDGDEDEELIDAEEVIKALTDKVEELEDGQQEILKALKVLTDQAAQDSEFKKSMGEGMIALMENYEAIAKSPLPRKGLGGLDAVGLNKGGLTGDGRGRKHRQLTAQDREELRPILTKAVEAKELDLVECGKLETQINKSIRDPSFQLDQKFLSFLESKFPKK
jgi:uncharacterized protein YfcZ (UPF0381/DUF406 family)